MSLILVQSPKGGVGVTMCAGSLAMIIAKSGATVTALDLTGQDSLKLWVGVRPEQVVYGAAPHAKDIMLQSGVRPVSVGRARPGAMQSLALVDAVGIATDYAIADIASDDEDTLNALMPRSSLCLTVLSAQAGSLALLPRALERAGEDGKVVFVVNNVDARRRVAADAARMVAASVGDRVTALIRHDQAVEEALASLEPLPLFAPLSAAVADLTALSGCIAKLARRPAARAPAADVG